MKYRTLIFDLDGTISDPSVGIVASVNHALETFGYEPVAAARIRQMIGPPLTVIFEHFLGALENERMIGLIDAYRDRYATVGYRENVLYEQIPEVLATLSQRGARLGVCTSKRADYAVKIVEMFGLARHFDFVDGGDVHVTKAEQLARIVADGVEAPASVMIGDRAVDMSAARSNRIDAIGARWGFAEPGELEATGPLGIAATPLDLVEIIACDD